MSASGRCQVYYRCPVLGDAACGQALTHYSRAIALKPDYAEAYNNRAYTNMAKQNYAVALPDVTRAIELRPDNINALMNRGDICNYYYAIDRRAAIADYDRVMALHAADTSVCGHRAMALAYPGDAAPHNDLEWSKLVVIFSQMGRGDCTSASPVPQHAGRADLLERPATCYHMSSNRGWVWASASHGRGFSRLT